MDALHQDLRHAIRHLRHSPGFALSAILILALGIGANTAMVSILNGLLLRPLNVKEPDSLIGVSSYTADGTRRQFLIPIVEMLERDGPFEAVCGINGGGIFAVEANGIPAQTSIAVVTGGCFNVFGVAPLWGRTIQPGDAPADGNGSLVTVIGHRFWMRAFNGDPGAIGKTIRTDGVELTIIGVMPPGFVGLQADAGTDFFVPNYSVTPRRAERPASVPYLLGRLKPGVTVASAQAELTARWPVLVDAATPSALPPTERAQFTRHQPRVEPAGRGVSFYRDRYGLTIRIIVGLTSVLMLLACINLGGLLLTRLNARGAEMRVRLALGSTGRRLAQQMMLESLVVSLSGAALAIPLAFAFVGIIASFIPNPMVDNSLDFSPDGRVLTITAAIGVVAGLLISALPIGIAWRRQGRLLATPDRTVVSSTSRWARGLLVAQVALSMVMLTGAALLIRSLYLLQRVDPGVRTDQVLIIDLMPLPSAYRGIDNATYYRTLHDQIAALPNVRGIAFTRVFPSGGALTGTPVGLVTESEPSIRAQLESASPGLFQLLGVPLHRGRMPEWTDTATTQPVAIVSESLARRLVPDGDVIGRHVKFGANRADQDVEIVGVVGNISLGNLRSTDFPVFYRPMLQAGPFANYPNLLVRTEGDPLAAVAGIQDIVRRHGKEYAHRINTLEQTFRESPSNERMSASLAGVIAAMALALAFVGVYSLLAYGVTRRTREIGVRVALGAERSSVMRMVMREGVILTAIGVALGIPAVLAASRILGTVLFGVSGGDPFVLTVSIMLFLILGLAAGLLPARRAASVDPAIALRNE